jgi:hypothetical protein
MNESAAGQEATLVKRWRMTDGELHYVGDPLPGQGELLPSRSDLEAHRSVTVRPPFGREPNAPGRTVEPNAGHRSVRSVDSQGEGT